MNVNVAAESVDCPTCTARAGERCKSRFTGYFTVVHSRRVAKGALAAERARIRGELLKLAYSGPGGLLRAEIDRICPEEG